MICMGRQPVYVYPVCLLTAVSHQTEVFQYVILGMPSDPGPDIFIYGLHHPRLCLPDGDLEAFGLTVTRMGGRVVADGTVRVHSDDGLPGSLVPGTHLSNGGEGPRR
jgi:hypothetical protein